MANCITTVQFNNTSTICSDAQHSHSIGQECESYFWDFGDGTTSTQKNPVHNFASNGFAVKLIAYMSEDQCSDSTVQWLSLYSCPTYDTIYQSICAGDTFAYYNRAFTRSGPYHITVDSIRLEIQLYLNVMDSLDTNIYASICQGDTFSNFGFTAFKSGLYADTLQSYLGCDSIAKLHLTVTPLSDTINASICEGETYSEHGFNESQTGVYFIKGVNENGCDTTTILNLTVRPTRDTTIDAIIMEGSTFNNYGINTDQEGQYQSSFIS